MRFFLTTCLVMLLVFTAASAMSQPLVHRLGVEDGLSNNTLYDLVQDQRGYIWLATTESGLMRYDGYRFMNFAVLDDEESIDNVQPDIGKLLLDSQQRLWVGTWGLGVSRLSADRAQLTRFLIEGLQVQSLLETADGSIWAGTTKGLYRIASDDSVERIGGPGTPNSFADQRIWSLAEGKNGVLWIGTGQGFYFWDKQNGLSEPLLLASATSTASRLDEVRALLFHNDTLWLGGRKGLSKFDPVSKKLTHLTNPIVDVAEAVAPDFLVNILKLDSANHILIGTYEGLYRFSPAANSFIPFRDQYALLPTLNVRAILEDRSGLLWLGTRLHGLFFTRYSKSAFSELTHPFIENLIKNYAFSVTGIAVIDSKHFWLTAGHKLYQLALDAEQMQSFSFDTAINKVLVDADKTLFIATDTGVFTKSIFADKLEPFLEPFRLAGLNQPLVRDLLIMPNQRFWFGLWGQGILYYDKPQAEVRHFLQDLSLHHTGDAIQAMTVMADDSLWVGTRYSGLYQIDAQKGIVAHLREYDDAMLPSDKIQCLENDGASLLLICTNRGLVLWDLSTNNQTLLGEHDGLASDNVIGALIEDKRIWALTGQGISLISPDLPHIVTFTRRDGLTATEINSNAHAMDALGNLYFGTLQGVIKADPSLLWTNTKAPAPQVTAVRVNHAEVRATEQYVDSPLQLAANENIIEIQFSAMDYHDVSRNRYRYKLTGFDRDWVYAANRPFAVYSNLPPGSYEFLLMAMNNHGLISTEIERFNFIVQPRWWQLLLVQIALVLLALLLLLAFHFYRMRHINQVNKLLNLAVEEKANNQVLLEQTVSERTVALKDKTKMLSAKTAELEHSLQALADKNTELTRLDKLKDQFVSTVSHELRTPLTAIRGAIGLLSKDVVKPGTTAFQKLLDVTLLNSERLSQLINDLLDLQKFDDGNFTLEQTDFDLNIVTTQALHAIEPYAARFNVLINMEPAVQVNWVYADQLRIRQVIDNLLSNAIKFSNEGQTVTVRIHHECDDVIWSVQDQGRGISDAFAERIFTRFTQADGSAIRTREGTGLGLAICKKIIDSHQGEIGFNSQLEQGSVFWFRLTRRKNNPQQAADNAAMGN